MKSVKKKMFTLIELMVILFIVLNIGAYVGNIVRLCNCNFKESYKAEIVYALGLFTPTYIATAFIKIED